MVNILIAGSERLVLFKRCLDSVLANLKQNKSIIQSIHITVNDEYKDELEKWLSSKDIKIKIHGCKSDWGPSRRRNLLIQNLNLDHVKWVLFIDDDVYLPNNFFNQLEQVLNEIDSDVMMVGGPNLTPPGASWFQQIQGEALGLFWCVGPYAQRYEYNYNQSRVVDDRGLTTSNLLVHSQLLKSLAFNEEYICAEDSVFIRAALSLKIGVMLTDAMMVYHERRDNFKKFSQQLFKYGFGRGLLISKLKTADYPQLLLLLIFIMILVCVVNKNWFSLLFGFSLYFVNIFILTIHHTIQKRELKYIALFMMAPLIHFFYSTGLVYGIARGALR